MIIKKEYDVRPVMDDLNPEMYIGYFVLEGIEKIKQSDLQQGSDYSRDSSAADY